MSSNRIRAAHGAPANTRWDRHKPFTGNKLVEMQIIYSALRRFAVRGHLDQVYLPIGVSKELTDALV